MASKLGNCSDGEIHSLFRLSSPVESLEEVSHPISKNGSTGSCLAHRRNFLAHRAKPLDMPIAHGFVQPKSPRKVLRINP